jgi:trk system potassium uptake protein TrkA
VRNPEYHREIGFIKEELGLSMVVNPELAAAAEISKLIQVPSAMEIDTFAKGKINLVKFEVPMNSAWAGMKIMEVSSRMRGEFLICIIERKGADGEGEVIIPDGVEGEKALYFTGNTKAECWMDFFMDNPDVCFNEILSYSWT